jgi:hypothetical protein
LNAPRLLNQLFEANLIQWLVVPANMIAQMTVKKALELLEKLTGAGFMGYLLEFARAIFEIRAGFAYHLNRVIELLESDRTGVVLVTGAHADFAEELSHFKRHLMTHGLKLEALFVNRTLSAYPTTQTTTNDTSPGMRLLLALRERESMAIVKLKQATGQLQTTLMPELARDVHTFEDLLHVARNFARNVAQKT